MPLFFTSPSTVPVILTNPRRSGTSNERYSVSDFMDLIALSIEENHKRFNEIPPDQQLVAANQLTSRSRLSGLTEPVPSSARRKLSPNGTKRRAIVGRSSGTFILFPPRFLFISCSFQTTFRLLYFFSR